MRKRKTKHSDEIELINKDLLDKSFQQFILLSLTDDQLEDYGKKFNEWFNRRYDDVMDDEIEKDEMEMLVKNFILLCYVHKNQKQESSLK